MTKSTKPPLVTSFDRWVSENNVSTTFEYSKGWWDYVEMIRRFATKLDVEDVIVVGHYVIRTPPPEEQLPLPAVALIGRGLTVAIKWDFGACPRWPREWTLSVRRRTPYLGPIFGLFDADVDLRGEADEGLGPEYIWGSFRQNPAQFTCEVDDEWDLAAVLRIMSFES